MPIKLALTGIMRFFLSRKVAIALLILMAALLFTSTRYPDLRITSSPFFLILPAFIFTSVLLCTVDRLRKRRVRDAGFWGSMLFHAGLLTIIAAAVVTRLTLFEGEMLLTESFPTPLGRDGFLKIWGEPVGGIDLPAGTITLDSFRSIYKDDFPIDHEARLSLETGGMVAEKTVRVNEPLVIEGLQYTLNRYGFSPAFVVENEKGEVLLDAFINLVVVGGAEDSLKIPGTGYTVFVQLFPDFEMTKEGPVSRSKLPKNPVVAVKVKSFGKESKYYLIKKGEKREVMGLTFTFSDLRYWSHFLVSKDLGVPVFLAGFVLAVTGLSMRFLTMKRRGQD